MDFVAPFYKMASNRHDGDEAAPLLADENLNEDAHTNGDLKSISLPSSRSRFRQRSMRVWRWLQSNVMILALTALLFGGLIALIVSIARMKASPVVIL